MANDECRISNEAAPKTARAIELARALYAKHGGSLEQDIRSFGWPNGIIVDEPDCFAIAYGTETPAGEWAWFVKTAVGDLAQLLAHVPFDLPFIAFHREKTGSRLKFYRTERLREIALRAGRNAQRPTEAAIT